MAVFRDDDHSFEVLGGTWKKFLEDPVTGQAYRAANIIIKYKMKDPEGIVYVTPNGLLRGDHPEIKPDVEMTLSCDTAHFFWLGKISMPVAMAKRLIQSKGSMNVVMRMLPLLKPLFVMYPDICRQHGLPMEMK